MINALNLVISGGGGDVGGDAPSPGPEAMPQTDEKNLERIRSLRETLTIELIASILF
jgi:hypothetical protein